MPLYEVKAYEANGTRITETLEAATEQDAFRRLASRGLTVAGLKLIERRQRQREVPKVGEPQGGLSLFRRLKQEDVVFLCREFAIMMEAGVPILEAMTSLEENVRHPALHAAVHQARNDISGGISISDALRGSPKVFPTYFCDIIHAAEEGGNLAAATQTGASQMEQALELKRKVTSALLYPLLLLSIAVIVACVLVVFVLPRFGKIFQNMGTQVPVTTQMMLAGASFAQHRWYVILGTVVVLVITFRRLLCDRRFATAWTRLVMRMPLFGNIVTKLAVSKALAVLSSMLQCNVPLLSALGHAARISGNLVVEDALKYASERVEGGTSLADALREIGVMPHVVTQMVSIGERTGTLPMVVGRTAAFFESEVDNRLKSLTSIIEPVMIVALGVFIGFIALSVITPIYSLVGSVK
jgi:type IV pilus assembly protein PilC